MSRARLISHHPNEKGLPLPASAAATVAAGRPKRRRILILGLLAIAATLFVIARRDGGRLGVLSDVRQLATEGHIHVPGPSPSTDDVDQEITKVVVNAQQKEKTVSSDASDRLFEPTTALRKLAFKLHLPLPSFGKAMSAKATGKPSHTDGILLLLSAVRNKAYTVPADAQQRLTDLQPKTMQAFARMLSRVRGEEQGDSKLYLESHDSWLQKHRRESPLTVFSKSYCPYSKRAKALLTQMGADFEVYEVDQRADGAALQASLRELSGHATFPAIFVRDELIGGSDDLSRLDAMGVLHGILEGAGVPFKAKTHAGSA